MSLYSGKTTAVVGEVSGVIERLCTTLSNLGINVEFWELKDAAETLSHQPPDLLILNALSNRAASIELLNTVRTKNLNRSLPVLALTENDQAKIQNMLTLGAADYFTEKEPPAAIETKARMLLGEPNNFEGVTVIDIPSDAARTKRTGVRVFAVEDDPLLRNLLSIRFEKSEFPFAFSVDGRNAVEDIRKFQPQVIVLDLMLPGVNGLDILAELRADEQLKMIPVVIFSNRDEQSDRARANELGAQGFFVKALTDLSELVETLASLAE